MIEVTIKNILNNIKTFQQLSEESLPIKTAFCIARLIRELDKENAVFEDCRKKIIEKYAEKTETNEIKTDLRDNIIIQKEYLEEFNKEILDLLETVVNINAEKIELDNIENIKLTPAQAIALEPFLK